jgi:hypothetical protein
LNLFTGEVMFLCQLITSHWQVLCCCTPVMTTLNFPSVLVSLTPCNHIQLLSINMQYQRFSSSGFWCCIMNLLALHCLEQSASIYPLMQHCITEIWNPPLHCSVNLKIRHSVLFPHKLIFHIVMYLIMKIVKTMIKLVETRWYWTLCGRNF